MELKHIESPANPAVKETMALVRKRTAKTGGPFLIESPHLLEEAMRSGRTLIRRVFALPEFLEPRNLLDSFAGSGVELIEAGEKVIKRLSSTDTPQGLVALAEMADIPFTSLPFKGLTIVLDNVQDPGNVGTIIRTAHAFGAGAVVLLPGSCDAFNPKALRASAGSVFHIPVARAELAELLPVLAEKDVRVTVTEPRNGVPLGEANLTHPIALCLGSEAHGISFKLRKAADLSLTIPIPGGAESLNVAQAAAICLWEMTKSS
jgi:TrmH family RNA methyltransferase